MRVRKSELLGRLVENVFDEMQDVWLYLFQLMLDLELYVAALRFRGLAKSKGLEVSLPRFASEAEPCRFEQLFNPFLLLESTPPVPCDIEHGQRAISIVTGPNSGGKTRLLQAVGLTQVLAQAGLFVPAQGACLSLRSGMFVSLV